MISPTALLLEALGPHPQVEDTTPPEFLDLSLREGIYASKPDRCVMCGAEYEVGQQVAPFEPSDLFTDYSLLANPSGSHVCRACKVTWNNMFMQTYAKSLVCKDGLYPFFSDNDVGYWLLNPPEPPYLMFISTKRKGHVIWKAPVNFSRDISLVRYDDNTLKIRQGPLKEEIEAAQYLSALMQPPTKSVSAFYAVLELDRDLFESCHGRFRRNVFSTVGDNREGKDAIQVLQHATAGEMWALAHILKSEEAPTKPPRKLIPTAHITHSL